MLTLDQIVLLLKEKGDKDKVILKEKKFGITAINSLGIYHSDLREIVKKIEKNNKLAIQLFDSGIYEARILCSRLYNVNDLTEKLMESWVTTFENWEICDTFCMGLFSKSKFAVAKAIEWTQRKKEFEKRAGFAIIASYCMADKKAQNEIFEQFFPLIIRESTDDRVYVKKSISWALRNIGKRNKDLRKQAIKTAKYIYKLDNKNAKWIAKDVCKELESDKVNIFDYPRELYRK